MTALPALDPFTAPPAAAKALAAAKAAFGDAGVLRQEVRERIALVVAEENGCAYCLSAHSYIAERGLSACPSPR